MPRPRKKVQVRVRKIGLPTDEDLARGWTAPGWYRDVEGKRLQGPHETRRSVWAQHVQQVTRSRGRPPEGRPARAARSRREMVSVQLPTGERFDLGPPRPEVDVEADAAGRNLWCPRYDSCMATVVALLDAALRARLEVTTRLPEAVVEKLKRQRRSAHWTCSENCPHRRERELPPRIVRAATMRHDVMMLF